MVLDITLLVLNIVCFVWDIINIIDSFKRNDYSSIGFIFFAASFNVVAVTLLSISVILKCFGC